MAVVAAPPWLQEALTSLTQSEAWKQIELLYNSASTEALIATAILGLLTLLLIQAWIFSPSPKLPGPSALPLLGNLAARNPATRHSVILQWADRYGGIFRIRTGRTPVVVISDPDLAQELLATHGDKLTKPSWYCDSLSEILPPPRTSLLTCPAMSERWRATRKCLSHSFSVSETSLDCDVCRDKALQLVDVLASLGSGVIVNMADACSRLALDSLGLAKLDYDFSSVDTPAEVMLLQLMKECEGEWAARRANPLRRWLWLFIDSWGEGRQRLRIWQDYVTALWGAIQARGEFKEDDCSIPAQLQRLRNPRTAAPVPDAARSAELAGTLLAGHAPLAASLQWALFLLASHPACQEALHTELLASGCVQNPEVLTLDTIGKFTYLDCVIRESLRLYPPSGEALYRRTTARVPLANGRYKLPRGTHVWVHTYAMQRSIHNWTNGADFDPTRWTDKDTNSNSKKSEKTAASKAGKGKTAAGAGKASDDAGGGSQGTKGYDGMASSEDVCAAAGYLSGDVEAAGGPDAGPGPQRCNKRAFMPFGAGERGCLGQAFAQAFLKLSLAVLVSYFKFELSGQDAALYACSYGLSAQPGDTKMPLILSLRHPDLFTD